MQLLCRIGLRHRHHLVLVVAVEGRVARVARVVHVVCLARDVDVRARARAVDALSAKRAKKWRHEPTHISL